MYLLSLWDRVKNCSRAGKARPPMPRPVEGRRLVDLVRVIESFVPVGMAAKSIMVHPAHACIFPSIAAIVLCASSVRAQPLPRTTDYARDIKPILTRYCFPCHGEAKFKGGLNLASRKGLEKPADWRETWARLRSRQMPPSDQPQPTPAEREKVTAWIEEVFSGHTLNGQPDPGQMQARRLNLREYRNTVRDLFVTGGKPSVRKTSFAPLKDGRISLYRLYPLADQPTDFVARYLPPDTNDGGFDTIADNLSLPPSLLEKHLRVTKVLLDDMYSLKGRDKHGRYQWALREEVDRLAKGPPKGLTPRQGLLKFLQGFAARAFRRPVDTDEAERYAKLFDLAQSRGEDFHSAIRLPLQAILIAPHFTLLWSDPGEEKREKGVRALTDHELAARLSYFLWSSLPDRELTQLADKGLLRDEEVLEAQIRRLMGDWRSRDGLLFGFLLQWLQLDRLNRANPDAESFPTFFTDNLGEWMTQEMVFFADAIVVEDRSILEFIDADWGFLCAPLAEHYGVADFPGKKTKVDQPPWYRVTFKDKRRGGVLTMGKVLTGTSQPLRTSPVHRGKWVLETILGTPPPPPPPEVDNVLPEEPDGMKKLTVPQLMARHRNNPACFSCHQMIDPLGIALENFDPAGKWRDRDQGQLIDTRGELVDGTRFDGVVELKAALMARKDDFVRGFVENMLTYALGRRLDFYDVPTVQRITRAVREDGYRFSRVVLEVARCYPFRNCRSSAKK